MASPFGDVSNSDRDPGDLPVLKKTYTVYRARWGGNSLRWFRYWMQNLPG